MNAKTELNLNEGDYTMWASDMPVAPEKTPSVITIAQTNKIQARTKKSGHILGVCSLITANQGQATSEHIDPAMYATSYFNDFDKNNKPFNFDDPRRYENYKRVNFDDAKFSVILQPKHGRLTNDVWSQDNGEYVALPADAKIFNLNRYQYIPDAGYEGKDFAIVQADKNGVKVSIYYFFHISVEVNAQYLCERKDRIWKISQFDFNPGTQDYAAWLQSAELSSLLAAASQSLTGFQEGSSVGQTTGEGTDVQITLDTTAAGHGRYIDPTLLDNTDDFLTTSNPTI